MTGSARPATGEKRAARQALVMEDEPLIADVMAAVLASRGFAVRTLPGIAGLSEALSPPPDIVLLDVSLAGSDAVDIMKALAGAGFAGDVLLVSGAAPELLDEVIRVGRRRGLRMLPPLAKPFRIGHLADIVDGVAPAPVASAPTPAGGDEAMPVSIGCAEALRRGLVEVWYQPKCEPRSARIVGAECLARVRLPGGEVVLPGGFLPGASPATLASLTEFVLARACRDWPAFAAAGHPVRLAINVPSGALVDMPLPLLLREHCPKRPEWPGLVLEITEEDACRDADALHEAGTQMGIYGVHLSVDDFGLGYSNLSRLSELSFREVKLDRSLVRDCHREEKRSALCRAVVDLAHACGAIVVAEGVERTEELVHLAALGCDAVQGFLLARPMPAAAFCDWLRHSGDGVARPALSAA